MKPFRSRVPFAVVAGAVAGAVAIATAAAGAQQQHMAMAMPMVAIQSPAAGETVTGTSIDVRVKPTNFKVECTAAGQPGTSPMQGHIHAMVDGMDMEHLANMYCSDHFTISTAGLAPGKHMLNVVLADDAHEMDSAPAMVPFIYAPAKPVALPAADKEKASIAILSPANGQTVGRTFDVKLAVNGFHPSCDLEGRADVPGYGHFHIFATQSGVTDRAATAPMAAMMKSSQGMMMADQLARETGMTTKQIGTMALMSMVGLLGMPCTTTIPVDLRDWHDGSVRIMVMLANDDHMPTPGIVPAAVTVTLK